MSFGLHPFGLVPFGARAATGAAPPGDTEAPTWTGPIVAGARTDTTIALTLPLASDNVAVSRYEYRVDGSGWVNNGASRAVGITGLTQLTSYTIDGRALDAAGNASTVLSVTVSTYRAGATGADILANTGPVGSSPAGILYDDVATDGSDDDKWFSFILVTPPASGTLTINPNGSFTFTGPSDTFFTYQLEVDGVPIGSPQTVSLYGTTLEAAVGGQGGTVKTGAGAVSVDLLALPVTVAIAGSGATIKAGAGAVSVDLLALPVAVAIAGSGATLKAGAGAVSVDIIPVAPGTVTVQVAGSGATTKTGTGAVSVTLLALPVITVAAQGQGGTIKTGRGAVFVSDGSIVWPTDPAGPTHRAVVPFTGVRAIVTAETVE